MTAPRAKMWETYSFHGYSVMVIQQWNDPFGEPMVRIAETSDEELAEGMSEAAFLADAVPVLSSERE